MRLTGKYPLINDEVELHWWEQTGVHVMDSDGDVELSLIEKYILGKMCLPKDAMGMETTALLEMTMEVPCEHKDRERY